MIIHIVTNHISHDQFELQKWDFIQLFDYLKDWALFFTFLVSSVA